MIEDIIIGAGDNSVLISVLELVAVASVVEPVGELVKVSVTGTGRGERFLAENFSPFLKEDFIFSNIPGVTVSGGDLGV